MTIAAERIAAMFDDALRAELAACMEELSASRATVHKIADLLGYVNWSDCGRYEQISDEKLIEKVLEICQAPAAEPLSEGEECVLSYVERYDAPRDAHVNELVKAIRKRFPKPEPARKTAQELAVLAREGRGGKYDDALAELVRRAEAGEP